MAWFFEDCEELALALKECKKVQENKYEEDIIALCDAVEDMTLKHSVKSNLASLVELKITTVNLRRSLLTLKFDLSRTEKLLKKISMKPND